MEAPAITRRRRPFLAPLWFSLLALLVLLLVVWSVWRGAGTTLVLVVRPTEDQTGAIADPPISSEGEERAQHLARMFRGGAGIDALYVSDDRRAQQTAAPLIEQLHRPAVPFAAAQAGEVASRLLQEHAGGTVLVIGSAAVIPGLLRSLTGESSLGHDGADLYLVSVPRFGRARLLRMRL